MKATKALKVALFVEGSLDPRGFFEKLWKQELTEALGLRQVDYVFPINKKHLVAMDPKNPKMSGAGEPLDQLMVRKLNSHSFDAAIIAWDLMPAWAGGSSSACRWQETKDLYWYLGMSSCLPEEWSWWSALKYDELKTRKTPGARAKAPQLVPYAALTICMEPVFEGLLAASENGIRQALGVKSKRIKGWPKGWGDPTIARPETALIQKALVLARAIKPPPAETKKIRGDMRDAKHEWGAYLVHAISQNPEARDEFEAHSIARRLREVLKK